MPQRRPVGRGAGTLAQLLQSLGVDSDGRCVWISMVTAILLGRRIRMVTRGPRVRAAGGVGARPESPKASTRRPARLAQWGRQLSYSVGMTIPDATHQRA
ncbi:hypothetical protein CP981_16265 [Streptomyces platensis]|uniref:Uncharacterized protein n=1 Tax=Streptomyces platensis TaxID=58346 RepID=A0AAE6TMS3_STRPT|nr:hypothetical protein CP981_16265 [Streptomyces platensis]